MNRYSAGAIVTALLIAALTAGCGTQPVSNQEYGPGFTDDRWPGVSPGPYSGDFISLLERLEGRTDSASDFVRRVLDDGVITESEFNESVDLQAQCMRDAGLSPVIQVDAYGIREIHLTEVDLPAGTGRDDWPQAFDACADRWDEGIGGLYRMMMTMPYGLPTYEQKVACLIHFGLAGEWLTGEDLAELEAPYIQTCDDPKGCVVQPFPTPFPEIPGGGGVRLGDPEYLPCARDPVGTMLKDGFEPPQ